MLSLLKGIKRKMWWDWSKLLTHKLTQKLINMFKSTVIDVKLEQLNSTQRHQDPMLYSLWNTCSSTPMTLCPTKKVTYLLSIWWGPRTWMPQVIWKRLLRSMKILWACNNTSGTPKDLLTGTPFFVRFSKDQSVVTLKPHFLSRWLLIFQLKGLRITPWSSVLKVKR